jgi:hypothetical protein
MFDWTMFTWAFVGGLLAVGVTAGACALAVALSYGWSGSRNPAVSSPHGGGTWLPRKRLSRTYLPAGASWSFADSWATNLTALITATAAVAALLGGKDLGTVFERKAPLAFSLTSAVMLLVAALAPVVYTVLERAVPPSPEAATEGQRGEDQDFLQGTMLGWCASAAVTLLAVEGSLSAAARCVLDVSGTHHVGRVIAFALVVLAMVLVAAYVARSFLLLLGAVQTRSGVALASMSGFVTVSCCSDPLVPTRLRVSLL